MSEYGTSPNDTVIAPARRMWLVVAHDTNAQPFLTKAIRANSAGTIVFKPVDSAIDVTLTVVAGEQIAVRTLFIRAASTAVVHGIS